MSREAIAGRDPPGLGPAMPGTSADVSRNEFMAPLALAVAGVVLGGDAAPRAYVRRTGEGNAQARCCDGEVAVAGNGVRVRFALPGDGEHFVLLAMPVLPGTYAIDGAEIDGAPMDDLARRVVSVNDRMEPASASHQVRFSNGRQPPTIELDLRDLSWSTDVGHILEVQLRRESSSDTARQLVGRIDSMSEASAAMQHRVGGILLGQSQRLDRLLESTIELESRLSGRIDGLDTALEQRLGLIAADLRRFVETEAATAARQLDALSALATRLDDLHARNERLLNAVENVFWRRWFRRLCGQATS
jgi:hypothetical protein